MNPTVHRLLADPAETRVLGKRARRVAIERYDFKRYVDRFLKIHRRVQCEAIAVEALN